MRRGNSMRTLMVKKIIILFIVCCLSSVVCGCGSSFHFSRQSFLKLPQDELYNIVPAKHELRVGEKLTYEIKWMGIPVAIAVFSVKEIVQINGRDCYHVEALVKTNAFLSKIYKVTDEFHSYIDKEKLYSLRFAKKQSEGKYRSDEVNDYDQDKHTGNYRSLRNDSTKNFTLTENIQDDLSSIYYFRMQDISIGKQVVMNVNADGNNWILSIDVLQKGCMKIYRIGKLDAIEVEPRARTIEGKTLDKGRLWIWFGADENRIPLAAKANAAIVGTVSAVLIDVK